MSARSALIFLAAIIIAIPGMAISCPAYGQLLKGNVSKDHELLRIAPPQAAPERQSPNLRIHRSRIPVRPGQGLFDSASFQPRLSGQIARNDAGIVNPGSFNLPNHFDIGADRNSRELVLAWEKWHKQLAGAIYKRWNAVADSPGKASVQITVHRDRTIHAKIINSTGSRDFDFDLLDSIQGLDGNPGLTFPAKSERQVVSFRGDYIAGTGIEAGYSWIKDDFERVRE